MEIQHQPDSNRLNNMAIISATTLKCLPFKAEPVKEWNEDTDLLAFLYGLLDLNFTTIDENGRRTKGNYKDLAPGYFDEGRTHIVKWIDQFYESATKFASGEHSFEIINKSSFENSAEFGRAGKYFVAWEQMVGNALADSVFFSIAHVLESEFDIKCSFHLAANLYYKQAVQVLRGYLESLVLPVYFCEYPEEFGKWKENDYRVPSLRGKRGILKRLSNTGIIPGDLSDQISFIYDELNSFIHGSEGRLISKGIFTGSYAGFMFKKDDFNEWCNYISNTIDVSIRLFAIHLDQWRLKSLGKRICVICHNSDFDITEYVFAGRQSYQYKCLRCGNEMHYSSK